jgi:subtilase family serine protease
MRSWKLLLPLLASTLCFAAQPDRIAGPIDSSQMVALTGNVHGFAQPRFDLGRTDGGKPLYGVTLAFRPSAAQQAALNNLLAQQQDRSSPNYHKWLTPAQFADRFGMTRDDIGSVQAWLESQGFTVTSIANSRNQIAFDGTVAQIESVFRTEIHNYLVDGVIHFANATNPSVPAAFAGLVLTMGHLHSFAPKPRVRFSKLSSAGADPHFTSYLSGNHFLTPGDFATIYDLPTGLDGTNQTIAIMGQSTVSASDLANFRSAAGLAAKVPTYILYPSNSTSTRCAGDEGESDLDLEWSNGVANNANVIFVHAGLVGDDTCANRFNSVWDALQQTVDNNYAPVISTSYGFCESGLPAGFPQEVQGWAQQANAQGQTIMASSGDSGAADCDPNSTDPNGTSATGGLAVDIPAAIPEVTGLGGTEFFGDAQATVANGNAAADPPYWSGTTGGTDTISSALEHIPEMGWNDTVAFGSLAASGGGASVFFAKPSWQTGAGVPNDHARDVPDLALNASPVHDPYLICSEDGPNGTVVATCTSGFRQANTDLTAVGGTSCAAPTFAAIVALLNQSLGASGLGNINPSLYALAASNPTAFHDVTTGNNIVPCTSGTPNCPSGTTQFGFDAGTGYDQVTGLGSVEASVLFAAWPGSRTGSSVKISPSATNVNQGAGVTFTATVTPVTGVGTVSFATSTGGPTTLLGTATLNIPYQPLNPNTGIATFTTTSLPPGSNSVTATYEGDASDNASTSAPTTVTVTAVDFTLAVSSALNPSSIPAGQTAQAIVKISPVNGSTQTINFTNSTSSNPESCSAGLPAGALCSFNPGSVTLDGTNSANVTLTITTAANMTPPSGVQAITVTGTPSGAGGTSHTTTVNLTVNPTNQSFTLSSTNGVTFSTAQGGAASVNITVAGTGSPISFVSGSTTALPLTYTCTGSPSLATAEITCELPNNGQPTNASGVTISLKTTAATTEMRPPLGGSRIFYALLLPGLFGIVFVAGSRTRGLRLLSLIVVLGFSTLWLGSCGGSSGGNTTPPNPGTPTGSYAVTINATTGGANPLTYSLTGITGITLNVTQ